MNPSDISAHIQSKIDTARIQECCRKHYEIFASALLAIAFVVFMSLDKGKNAELASWAMVALSILGVRFAFVQWFAGIAEEKVNVRHINVFVSIMFVWGLTWGGATLQFFPLLSTLQQAGWFAMFMVMIAASATSHSVYLSAFFAFALPYFLAIMIMVGTHYPSPYHLNAAILALVMITQVGAARKGQKVILASLKLRFQNQELVDKLKTERDSANKANHAKSKFLAAASHDLRQPLHALTLFSSALHDSMGDRAKTEKLIAQINESVDALQGLFNALLDVSRLDAGTLICEKAHFNSRLLTDKLANDFATLAREKGLEMEWNVNPTALYTDPTLLELILRNLLSNALRYTEIGKVTVRLVPKGQQVCIDVIDTGIGIAKHQQSHIFDEFVQLHNPERDRANGLGLGLAIVKRVAALLGTRVTVQSEEGKGTMFSLAIDAGVPEKLAEDEHANNEQDAPGGMGTVLVIDDEMAILQGMTALVEGWGYSVIAAQDLDESVRLLDEQHTKPDSIIADFRLRQGATGIEAIQTLREHYGTHIPAIVVSGDIAKERLQQVKACGLEMLHKPVPPARLRSFLRHQMR